MDNEMQPENRAESKAISVSPAVIKRLPRYFRYLREVIRSGKLRISSGELSELMNVTASQIRQDLNCFGEFGQQGYGYNVNFLYTKICEILGVGEGFSAVIIGAGNLGRALVRNPMFEKRGVNVTALFDTAPERIGTEVGGIPTLSMNEVENYCRTHRVDIAVLTLPKDCAVEAVTRLSQVGIRAYWNFTGKELDRLFPNAIFENVHIGDSLMTLCYELHCREGRT